jgi:tetratricopeptide (TPR) repeat protein
MVSLHRIATPAALLGLFYFGLFVLPRPSTTAGPLSVEQSERLAKSVDSAIERQRWNEALRDLDSLLKNQPNNSIYWSKVARAQNALQAWEEEAAALEMFWSTSSTPIEACPALSVAHTKAGHRDKAFDASRRCYELDPLNSDSVFSLAQAYERKDDRKRARELYVAGLKIAPDHLDMQVGLARLDLFDGSSRAAIDRARSALRRDPRSVDALVVLGMAYRATGSTAQAREALEKVLSLVEPYADAHLALAGIAVQEKDPDNARRHYARVLELDPSGSLGRIASEQLQKLKEAQP